MEKNLSVSKRNELLREMALSELNLGDLGYINSTNTKFVKNFTLPNGEVRAVRIDIVVPKEDTLAETYGEMYQELVAERERVAAEKAAEKAKKIAKDKERRAKAEKAKAEKEKAEAED